MINIKRRALLTYGVLQNIYVMLPHVGTEVS